MAEVLELAVFHTADAALCEPTDPECSSLGSFHLQTPLNHAAHIADLLERLVEWDATEEGMAFWLDVHERLIRIATKGG